MKWVKIVAVCAVVLGACDGGDDATAPLATLPTETSTSATTDVPPAIEPPPVTAASALVPSTGQDLIKALAKQGLPVGESVEWDEISDPNQNLGLPGEYFAKASWVDQRLASGCLSGPGWACGGDVELFEDPDDLQARWERLAQWAEDRFIGGYYMWRTPTALVRVGYTIEPPAVAEYQEALATIFDDVVAYTRLDVPDQSVPVDNTPRPTIAEFTGLSANCVDEVDLRVTFEQDYALLIGMGKVSDDDIEEKAAFVTDRIKDGCAEDSPYAMAEFIRRLVEEAPTLIGVSQRGLFPFLDAACARNEAAFDQYPPLEQACNEARTSPIRAGLPPPPTPATPSQSIPPGDHVIGPDGINPGTYVVSDVENCYWERLDSSGEIIDNNFVLAAPRVQVTIESRDYAFNSADCGTWSPAR